MGLFMESHNGQKWSRYFFLESRTFFSETRIFTSSREYFCRVENFFLESRFFSLSREYPACHAVICRQNDQTIWRSADLLVTFVVSPLSLDLSFLCLSVLSVPRSRFFLFSVFPTTNPRYLQHLVSGFIFIFFFDFVL